MLKVIRKFLMGAVAGLGFLAAVSFVGPITAATITYLTGPQPAADLAGIVNGVISQINTKLAPQGTGTMSSALGILGSGTGTTYGTNTAIQILTNPQGQATTTACRNYTGADWTFNVVDASGTVRVICAF